MFVCFVVVVFWGRGLGVVVVVVVFFFFFFWGGGGGWGIREINAVNQCNHFCYSDRPTVVPLRRLGEPVPITTTFLL